MGDPAEHGKSEPVSIAVTSAFSICQKDASSCLANNYVATMLSQRSGLNITIVLENRNALDQQTDIRAGALRTADPFYEQSRASGFR
jgi:hypothetical protein